MSLAARLIGVTRRRRSGRPLAADAALRIAGAGHDLRNVIMAIDGAAAMAADDLPAGHAVQRDLAEIRGAAARAAALTGLIMEISSGRPGGAACRTADLGSVVAALEPSIRRYRPGGVAVTLRLPSPGTSRVPVGHLDLERLVMNLVTNACDAMPEGGALDVEVRGGATGDRVELVVTDTGIGLPEALGRSVLDPYVTSKGPGGTGLGLAIIDQIVRSAGGRILLCSRVTGGTIATVSLPAGDPAPAPRTGRAAAVD